eukprot:PLAT7024.5.p1 GENE.PLAT7024.5~~PLAT7024.5.p1  ORF type:complete len:4159 (+),score=1526.28 PLAT7024.5:947-12478(+)
MQEAAGACLGSQEMFVALLHRVIGLDLPLLKSLSQLVTSRRKAMRNLPKQLQTLFSSAKRVRSHGFFTALLASDSKEGRLASGLTPDDEDAEERKAADVRPGEDVSKTISTLLTALLAVFTTNVPELKDKEVEKLLHRLGIPHQLVYIVMATATRNTKLISGYTDKMLDTLQPLLSQSPMRRARSWASGDGERDVFAGSVDPAALHRFKTIVPHLLAAARGDLTAMTELFKQQYATVLPDGTADGSSDLVYTLQDAKTGYIPRVLVALMTRNLSFITDAGGSKDPTVELKMLLKLLGIPPDLAMLPYSLLTMDCSWLLEHEKDNHASLSVLSLMRLASGQHIGPVLRDMPELVQSDPQHSRFMCLALDVLDGNVEQLVPLVEMAISREAASSSELLRARMLGIAMLGVIVHNEELVEEGMPALVHLVGDRGGKVMGSAVVKSLTTWLSGLVSMLSGSGSARKQLRAMLKSLSGSLHGALAEVAQQGVAKVLSKTPLGSKLGLDADATVALVQGNGSAIVDLAVSRFGLPRVLMDLVVALVLQRQSAVDDALAEMGTSVLSLPRPVCTGLVSMARSRSVSPKPLVDGLVAMFSSKMGVKLDGKVLLLAVRMLFGKEEVKPEFIIEVLKTVPKSRMLKFSPAANRVLQLLPPLLDVLQKMLSSNSRSSRSQLLRAVGHCFAELLWAKDEARRAIKAMLWGDRPPDSGKRLWLDCADSFVQLWLSQDAGQMKELISGLSKLTSGMSCPDVMAVRAACYGKDGLTVHQACRRLLAKLLQCCAPSLELAQVEALLDAIRVLSTRDVAAIAALAKDHLGLPDIISHAFIPMLVGDKPSALAALDYVSETLNVDPVILRALYTMRKRAVLNVTDIADKLDSEPLQTLTAAVAMLSPPVRVPRMKATSWARRKLEHLSESELVTRLLVMLGVTEEEDQAVVRDIVFLMRDSRFTHFFSKRLVASDSGVTSMDTWNRVSACVALARAQRVSDMESAIEMVLSLPGVEVDPGFRSKWLEPSWRQAFCDSLLLEREMHAEGELLVKPSSRAAAPKVDVAEGMATSPELAARLAVSTDALGAVGHADAGAGVDGAMPTVAPLVHAAPSGALPASLAAVMFAGHPASSSIASLSHASMELSITGHSVVGADGAEGDSDSDAGAEECKAEALPARAPVFFENVLKATMQGNLEALSDLVDYLLAQPTAASSAASDWHTELRSRVVLLCHAAITPRFDWADDSPLVKLLGRSELCALGFAIAHGDVRRVLSSHWLKSAGMERRKAKRLRQLLRDNQRGIHAMRQATISWAATLPGLSGRAHLLLLLQDLIGMVMSASSLPHVRMQLESHRFIRSRLLRDGRLTQKKRKEMEARESLLSEELHELSKAVCDPDTGRHKLLDMVKMLVIEMGLPDMLGTTNSSVCDTLDQLSSLLAGEQSAVLQAVLGLLLQSAGLDGELGDLLLKLPLLWEGNDSVGAVLSSIVACLSRIGIPATDEDAAVISSCANLIITQVRHSSQPAGYEGASLAQMATTQQDARVLADKLGLDTASPRVSAFIDAGVEVAFGGRAEAGRRLLRLITTVPKAGLRGLGADVDEAHGVISLAAALLSQPPGVMRSLDDELALQRHAEDVAKMLQLEEEHVSDVPRSRRLLGLLSLAACWVDVRYLDGIASALRVDVRVLSTVMLMTRMTSDDRAGILAVARLFELEADIMSAMLDISRGRNERALPLWTRRLRIRDSDRAAVLLRLAQRDLSALPQLRKLVPSLTVSAVRRLQAALAVLLSRSLSELAMSLNVWRQALGLQAPKKLHPQRELVEVESDIVKLLGCSTDEFWAVIAGGSSEADVALATGGKKAADWREVQQLPGMAEVALLRGLVRKPTYHAKLGLPVELWDAVVPVVMDGVLPSSLVVMLGVEADAVALSTLCLLPRHPDMAARKSKLPLLGRSPPAMQCVLNIIQKRTPKDELKGLVDNMNSPLMSRLAVKLDMGGTRASTVHTVTLQNITLALLGERRGLLPLMDLLGVPAGAQKLLLALLAVDGDGQARFSEPMDARAMLAIVGSCLSGQQAAQGTLLHWLSRRLPLAAAEGAVHEPVGLRRGIALPAQALAGLLSAHGSLDGSSSLLGRKSPPSGLRLLRLGEPLETVLEAGVLLALGNRNGVLQMLRDLAKLCAESASPLQKLHPALEKLDDEQLGRIVALLCEARHVVDLVIACGQLSKPSGDWVEAVCKPLFRLASLLGVAPSARYDELQRTVTAVLRFASCRKPHAEAGMHEHVLQLARSITSLMSGERTRHNALVAASRAAASGDVDGHLGMTPSESVLVSILLAVLYFTTGNRQKLQMALLQLCSSVPRMDSDLVRQHLSIVMATPDCREHIAALAARLPDSMPAAMAYGLVELATGNSEVVGDAVSPIPAMLGIDESIYDALLALCHGHFSPERLTPLAARFSMRPDVLCGIAAAMHGVGEVASKMLAPQLRLSKEALPVVAIFVRLAKSDSTVVSQLQRYPKLQINNSQAAEALVGICGSTTLRHWQRAFTQLIASVDHSVREQALPTIKYGFVQHEDALAAYSRRIGCTVLQLAVGIVAVLCPDGEKVLTAELDDLAMQPRVFLGDDYDDMASDSEDEDDAMHSALLLEDADAMAVWQIALESWRGSSRMADGRPDLAASQLCLLLELGVAAFGFDSEHYRSLHMGMPEWMTQVLITLAAPQEALDEALIDRYHACMKKFMHALNVPTYYYSALVGLARLSQGQVSAFQNAQVVSLILSAPVCLCGVPAQWDSATSGFVCARPIMARTARPLCGCGRESRVDRSGLNFVCSVRRRAESAAKAAKAAKAASAAAAGESAGERDAPTSPGKSPPSKGRRKRRSRRKEREDCGFCQPLPLPCEFKEERSEREDDMIALRLLRGLCLLISGGRAADRTRLQAYLADNSFFIELAERLHVAEAKLEEVMLVMTGDQSSVPALAESLGVSAESAALMLWANFSDVIAPVTAMSGVAALGGEQEHVMQLCMSALAGDLSALQHLVPVAVSLVASSDGVSSDNANDAVVVLTALMDVMLSSTSTVGSDPVEVLCKKLLFGSSVERDPAKVMTANALQHMVLGVLDITQGRMTGMYWILHAVAHLTGMSDGLKERIQEFAECLLHLLNGNSGHPQVKRQLKLLGLRLPFAGLSAQRLLLMAHGNVREGITVLEALFAAGAKLPDKGSTAQLSQLCGILQGMPALLLYLRREPTMLSAGLVGCSSAAVMEALLPARDCLQRILRTSGLLDSVMDEQLAAELIMMLMTRDFSRFGELMPRVLRAVGVSSDEDVVRLQRLAVNLLGLVQRIRLHELEMPSFDVEMLAQQLAQLLSPATVASAAAAASAAVEAVAEAGAGESKMEDEAVVDESQLTSFLTRGDTMEADLPAWVLHAVHAVLLLLTRQERELGTVLVKALTAYRRSVPAWMRRGLTVLVLPGSAADKRAELTDVLREALVSASIVSDVEGGDVAAAVASMPSRVPVLAADSSLLSASTGSVKRAPTTAELYSLAWSAIDNVRRLVTQEGEQQADALLSALRGVGLSEADVEALYGLTQLMRRRSLSWKLQQISPSVLARLGLSRDQLSKVEEVIELLQTAQQLTSSEGELQGTLTDSLSAVMSLCSGEVLDFLTLVMGLGSGNVNPARVRQIVNLVKSFAASRKESADGKDGSGGGSGSSSSSSSEEKSLGEMFREFDTSGDGRINYHEFYSITRYMNLRLSQKRAMKIFAQSDVDGSGAIDYDEFDNAMQLLRDEVSGSALRRLGLSTHTLILLFIQVVGVLLLFFAFIFVGIAAFTTGSTFGSVVNSALTVGSGLSLSGSDGDSEEGASAKVEKTVDKVLETISLK